MCTFSHSLAALSTVAQSILCYGHTTILHLCVALVPTTTLRTTAPTPPPPPPPTTQPVSKRKPSTTTMQTQSMHQTEENSVLCCKLSTWGFVGGASLVPTFAQYAPLGTTPHGVPPFTPAWSSRPTPTPTWLFCMALMYFRSCLACYAITKGDTLLIATA